MTTLKSLARLVLFSLLIASSANASSAPVRGMWVWTAKEVLHSDTLKEQLKALVRSNGITDLYLCLGASDYVNERVWLRSFNSTMRQLGVKTWGLDGSRAYFSDQNGPARLYDSVNALIAFNKRVTPNERFVGFQTDMEPQDQGDFKTTFHNSLADSELSTTLGGVWYQTEALDREMLMRDWLTIHQTIAQKLKPQGLLVGAAMVSWTSNFQGEEVQVTFNGVRQGVMKSMMDILTDYVVMTYNTSTDNAEARMEAQLTYADTLPVGRRPRVYGSVETNTGMGGNISYGDDPTKNTRTNVLADLAIMEAKMSAHPSFAGLSIEDWNGWRNLRP